jgi:hypothetical protein
VAIAHGSDLVLDSYSQTVVIEHETH